MVCMTRGGKEIQERITSFIHTVFNRDARPMSMILSMTSLAGDETIDRVKMSLFLTVGLLEKPAGISMSPSLPIYLDLLGPSRIGCAHRCLA